MADQNKNEPEVYFPVDVSLPGVQALLLTCIKVQKAIFAWEEEKRRRAEEAAAKSKGTAKKRSRRKPPTG